MTQLPKFIRRNPTESAMFGVAIAVALLNVGGIKSALDRTAMTRAAVQSNQEQVQALQIESQKKADLAEIANARFDAGCEMVLSLDRPDHYKALVEGSPVMDGVYADRYRGKVQSAPVGAFLPAGMTVCDAHGNSAVLVPEKLPDMGNQVYPVARQFATTTDVDRIRKAMQRVQAKWNPGVK